MENYNNTCLIDGYVKKRKIGGVMELASSEVTPVAGKDLKAMEESDEPVYAEDSLLSPSPVVDSAPVRNLLAGSERAEEEDRSACLSHGSISVIGRRRAMEDAVTVVTGLVIGNTDLYDFFAVYDGHGGAKVADACSDRLHSLVAAEMEGRNGGGGGGRDWEKVMVSSFVKMDEEVNGGGVEVESDGGSVAVRTVGSTAVVVVVGREEIVVANCGDSRAVLCRGGVALPLSRDHKPDRPDERERVEAAGGRVVNWNGYRILGVLATSRSIGDHYLKPFVIPEPEVTVRERSESDNFIIIASDGLWDVISNEIACEVARRCLDGRISDLFPGQWSSSSAEEAAAILAELAMARGSRDNISVVVVELNKPA